MYTFLTSTSNLSPKCFSMSKLNAFVKLLKQRLFSEVKLLRYNLHSPQPFYF